MINNLKDSLPIVDEGLTMSRRFRDWTNDVVRDASVGDWQDVVFENGWSNESFVTDFNDVQFRSLGDKRVEMRGLAVGGTVGTSTPIFTLPVGFRPILQYVIVAISNDLLGRVEIKADGGVALSFGSNVYVSLDGMIFSTD